MLKSHYYLIKIWCQPVQGITLTHTENELFYNSLYTRHVVFLVMKYNLWLTFHTRLYWWMTKTTHPSPLPFFVVTQWCARSCVNLCGISNVKLFKLKNCAYIWWHICRWHRYLYNDTEKHDIPMLGLQLPPFGILHLHVFQPRPNFKKSKS